jgi:hypothetical protein
MNVRVDRQPDSQAREREDGKKTTGRRGKENAHFVPGA